MAREKREPNTDLIKHWIFGPKPCKLFRLTGAIVLPGCFSTASIKTAKHRAAVINASMKTAWAFDTPCAGTVLPSDQKWQAARERHDLLADQRSWKQDLDQPCSQNSTCELLKMP